MRSMFGQSDMHFMQYRLRSLDHNNWSHPLHSMLNSPSELHLVFLNFSLLALRLNQLLFDVCGDL
jgi:hypothetical protein